VTPFLSRRYSIFEIAGTGMAMESSSEIATSSNQEPRRGMVLPFQPLSLAFDHISYYVDMPAVSHRILESAFTSVHAMITKNFHLVDVHIFLVM